MTTLKTLYENYKKNNPDSVYGYNEWLTNVHNPMLLSILGYNNFNFKKSVFLISNHLTNLPYDDGDLSDIGNEIGFIIGKTFQNMSDEQINEFIVGFKHGIYLTKQ